MKPGIGIGPGHLAHAGLGLLVGERREIELDVGALRLRPRAEEAAALVDAERQRPFARQHVLHAGQQLAPPRMERVVERRHLGAIDVVEAEMVLQVSPDRRTVMHHLDAAGAQHVGGPDARQLQQLRRIDRAAGEDDFAARARLVPVPALLVGDADGALALEQDAGRQRVGLDAQVRPALRRPQIGARRRHAQAAMRGDLVDADAFDGLAVEIGIEREAGLLPRFHPQVGQRMDRALDRVDMQRPAGAVPRAGAERMVLHALVERQHVVPAPAGIAHRRPVVVVAGLAARIDHGVDRAGAAQHLAAREIVGAVVEAGIGSDWYIQLTVGL